MGTFAEAINKELIRRYKKDKIKDYLIAKEKKVPTEKRLEAIDKLSEEFYKKNLTNVEVMKKISDFVVVQYSDSYDVESFHKLINEAKRKKSSSFCVKFLEKIHSEHITSYSYGLRVDKKIKDRAIAKDMTGLFKVHFSDETFMYYAKWMSGGGKARTTEGMFAAESKVWYKYLKLFEQSKNKGGKPKNGVFRIFTEREVLCYKKLEKMQETPIVHKVLGELKTDMSFYFENVPLFMRFGMSGVRKVLFVGPPGTGKSSAAIKVAKSFCKEKCVVFTTSIGDVAGHLYKCSKYNVSTVVILEDAESTLAQANSALLNFMDGVDQPKNLNGSYIIMTTNFPERIEPRILKRPGRVDKIFSFGVLEGAYALNCAKIYFDTILFNKKNLKDKKINDGVLRLVNKMSGAAIKELSQATAAYAASSGEDVSVELIAHVKKEMYSNMQNVEKFAKESSMERGVGFVRSDDNTNNFDIQKVLEESVEEV